MKQPRPNRHRPPRGGAGRAGRPARPVAAAAAAATGAAPGEAPGAARFDGAALLARPSFRVAAALAAIGPLLLLVSQAIAHDYGFFELGGLFTLSIYDLVLGMLGLSACGARCTARQFVAVVAVFAAVAVTVLLWFDPVFETIVAWGLDEDLFLVTPLTVMLIGASLWVPAPLRFAGAVLAAALTGLDLALFIGLDDIGVGIPVFAAGAMLSALWLIVAPGLLLRQFDRTWLTIPGRIVGSWLMVIGAIVLASMYAPQPVVAPDGSGPGPDGSMTIEVPADPVLEGGESGR